MVSVDPIKALMDETYPRASGGNCGVGSKGRTGTGKWKRSGMITVFISN
jgi:hypothetical protein